MKLDPSRQLVRPTLLVFIGGCSSLVVLGVLAVSGVADVGEVLLPAAWFVILLTSLGVVLMRRF